MWADIIWMICNVDFSPHDLRVSSVATCPTVETEVQGKETLARNGQYMVDLVMVHRTE